MLILFKILTLYMIDFFYFCSHKNKMQLLSYFESQTCSKQTKI